jgi:hypothetical protein
VTSMTRSDSFGVAIFLLFLSEVFGQSGVKPTSVKRMPRFDDFAVASPRAVASATDRKGGGVPNESSRYARHFTLSKWNCGTNCTGISVTDILTGKRHRTMPFIGVMPCASKSDMFVYRADSRLLVINGSVEISDETGGWPCGTALYEWTGTEFLLIRRYTSIRTVK